MPWYERANLDIQEFSAAGVRTFAVVEGKPEAFPVIFLHGLPGGAFIWTSVIKALGRSRLSIAPDLPGWGRSFSRYAKTAPDLSVDGMRAWLSGLLAAHRVERFDLVAHGNGAWPALELLIADPSRVRRLGLVSAELWETGHATRMKRLLGHAKWSAKRIEHWLNDRAALSADAKESFLALFANALGSGKDARTSPMLSESGFPERMGAYRTAVEAYKGALLFIWGMHDPQAPPEKTRELVSRLKDPEVHRIENAGHYPMLDAPDDVAAILKEFLQD